MDHPVPFITKIKKEIPADAQIIEHLNASLEELFFIEYPQYKKRTPEIDGQVDAFINDRAGDDCWVYYPWRNIAIHTVSELFYFRLRTARNRNVITEEQQKKYRDLVIGVAGLSVGSAVLAAVTTSGGPKTMKIADFDVLELTNLNRIRAALPDIGSNKTHVAAREIWELDPFADLILFDKGISRETIEDFILGSTRLDVFIDEMDSIDLKIIARGICKKNNIPVLMATDNGDGIILDVERFDEEPERQIFHGLIPDMDPKELGALSFPQWLQLATKIVGPEYLTESMQDSLLAIGKTIPSVPQLGASAALAGSAMSFVLRKIACGEPMPSGRYTMGFEEKLIPHYRDPDEAEKRKKKTESFLATFSKNQP
jgi:hypothetical protein